MVSSILGLKQKRETLLLYLCCCLFPGRNRMDITSSLKSLLLAIRQYRDSRTAQHAAQLHKQVEGISHLEFDRLLSSAHFLPTECVSGLVELAGNPNTSPALTSAIISLLAQLGNDDASREILHKGYNLTSTLAAVIHCHSSTPGEPLVLQCLQVLQKLTYSTHSFQFTSYIQELIAFLLTNIQSQNEEILVHCLALMANLCRDNPSVQSHIKSMDNVRRFYRTLFNLMAHNSLTVVIFALSIVASLTLNEKFFDAQNIHQTFQLVFNIMVNGNGSLTMKYAVNVLVDLLKSSRIVDYLTKYQHLSACVSQVLGLLHCEDPDSAATVLELLLAMCCVPGLRSQLCDVVFRPARPKLRVAAHGEGAGGRKPVCGLALVQWLSSPVEGAEKCLLQTLQLLNELLEESLGAERVSESVLNFVEMLLPVVLGLLKGPVQEQGDAHLRKHFQRVTHISTLLLTLCCVEATRSMVSSQVSAQLCLSQVEILLSCCHSYSSLTCLSPVSSKDLSQLCAEALLKTLELMSKLRQQVKDMETSFYRILQDQRTVTPLALALTSQTREQVQTGLSLLLEATPLPDFPLSILGESMAANNALQRQAELSAKRVAVQEAPPPKTNGSMMDVSKGYGSMNNLVEKIQAGLELQEQTKDPSLSEVIDVYEQKLAGFASKESRLQELLEAKALALSQADRLIAEYRLQRAQAEAEARKLAGLLKDTERRREDLQGELSNQVLEMERAKADMKLLLQHKDRLQKDSEEHQVLKGAYNALLNRFNETERLLKEVQAAHMSLNKQNDALKKDHKMLQQQKDRITSTLQEREEEIKSLQSDLKNKNSDITGLHAELRSKEEELKLEEQKRRDLEETVDLLRKELSKTEQARKDASIKASSLELQKDQLEVKLKQKEEELNKNSAMIAMIHSLSSGKLKGNVNLSL
ncbi:protein CIP2A homolog isoform X2 [Cyprinodon tularosa]|uniref:protein CIP2A homolog isoform X2 n=1 Tax=Cyprinodon tularosa TaxID=77115 RepID=UPI0018E22D1A|nr:protein CIP2A homolog isoform X2 [Cyprinodon tularosa]